MKLCFPEDVLKQHLVTLGKTGSGKSSKLRVIVEYLLRHKKRVCIIDIKGDWWGLKSSADGKSAGFPVIAFGNFREPKATDVPINPRSGQHIAELITSGNRPCIIGFRGWMPSEITDFWLDFAPALFNKNEGELYVVISECHNFAPKGKVMDPKSGKLLHWTNRLLTEGRGLGMTFLLDSQRPQKVHNDTLTSCETLIACRITYPADRDAIKEWINGCGDSAQGKQVLDSLASLSRSEAWMWSPEVGFGPQRVTFPMFETFDSFAPAQLQKTVSQDGWSTVDLDEVKNKLASVIEEAKGNDPKELKARIRDLEKKLDEIGGTMPTGPRTVTEYVADPEAILKAIQQRDEQWRSIIQDFGLKFRQHMDKAERELCEAAALGIGTPGRFTIGTDLRTVAGAPVRINRSMPSSAVMLRSPVSEVRLVNIGNGAGEKLPKAERTILTALAQYPQGRTKVQVALLGSYSHTGGGFNNALSALRGKGYIEGEDTLRITQSGVKALGHFNPLPTGKALLEHWYRQLGKAERSVLEVVAHAWPRSVSKEDVAGAAGYEPTGGGFNNALSRLRTFELISGKGELKASDDLFN